MGAEIPISVPSLEPDRTYSRVEFRRWYDAQPRGRYERIDGRVVAMAAQRLSRVRVRAAVYLALSRAVAHAGIECEALPNGVTFETGDSDYHPDALVNCGARMADDAVAAPNPVVVVEVLSPGTASTDTGAKLAGYFRVPSVAHYLIVHPTKRIVTHHRRNGDAIETLVLVGGPITMDPPGIAVTVEELYGSE